MVHSRIDVVGPPRQHDGAGVEFSDAAKGPSPLRAHIRFEVVETRDPRLDRRGDLAAVDIGPDFGEGVEENALEALVGKTRVCARAYGENLGHDAPNDGPRRSYNVALQNQRIPRVTGHADPPATTLATYGMNTRSTPRSNSSAR